MSNYDDILSNTPESGQQTQLSKEEYAAKKKAERDDVFTLSDTTALAVAADGGKFSQYLDLQARVGRYSAVNTLLILAQMPEANRLGDFDHWKGLGGYVKRNPVSISILEPHEYVKDDGTPGTGYNIKKVYDISQVDTRKMKISPPPSYDNRLLLKALVHNSPVKIQTVDAKPEYLSFLPDNFGAFYDQKSNQVIVQKGMEFSDIFKSVARELALADLLNSPDAQAETNFSAYCASYLLCKKHGVDTHGFDFTKAPNVFTGMEAQSVKAELSQIRDVADDISGRMARQLDAAQKAAKTQEAR